jgi:hypothetical protein
MLWFCEKDYVEAQKTDERGLNGGSFVVQRRPFSLMTTILFDYSVLDFFLRYIRMGILHDPRNPRDMHLSRKAREEEKDLADSDRRRKTR